MSTRSLAPVPRPCSTPPENQRYNHGLDLSSAAAGFRYQSMPCTAPAPEPLTVLDAPAELGIRAHGQTLLTARLTPAGQLEAGTVLVNDWNWSTLPTLPRCGPAPSSSSTGVRSRTSFRS